MGTQEDKKRPRATGKFSMYCTTVQLLVNGSIIINRVFDKKHWYILLICYFNSQWCADKSILLFDLRVWMGIPPLVSIDVHVHEFYSSYHSAHDRHRFCHINIHLHLWMYGSCHSLKFSSQYIKDLKHLDMYSNFDC